MNDFARQHAFSIDAALQTIFSVQRRPDILEQIEQLLELFVHETITHVSDK
jgi:hypothetical protein